MCLTAHAEVRGWHSQVGSCLPNCSGRVSLVFASAYFEIADQELSTSYLSVRVLGLQMLQSHPTLGIGSRSSGFLSKPFAC